MSTNSFYRRSLTAFALLIALALASVPAQARPVHRPATGLQAVAGFGENALARLWSFVASLLPQGTVKEGMSIDPDGAVKPSGTSTVPGSSLNDEGVTIDPNGRN
jgi:hypothetical protein